MKAYKNLAQFVLENGERRDDRTGVGTISVFGPQIELNLQDGFPLLTLKRTPFKSILSELLWFVEGSNDERRLAEILHGDRDESKKTIWTQNATAPYWVDKAKFSGDLGRIYGVQWRSWTNLNNEVIDQLQGVINLIKNDPYSRRIILSAWNPGELHLMGLPPCHSFAQFYCRNGFLDCKMYQRSADVFLGVPFNIASYALLMMMIAQVCGLKPGRFIHTFGDAHIYLDHIEQVKLMLEREPLPLPTVEINQNIKDINDFTMSDFKLINYNHHAQIKADMAV